ncbi:cupredoxin domain-containing protein [Mycobacterium bohemicum]|uniref:Amidase n=1 Tax=Mycobacterium bohemicum TaxID=56425 RepID=A0A1X1RBV5_MYCBE|nr:cupredoxin family copper-binding protein [Mycobacterium bohemicum]MCV6969707.1 cupredoxin family copper-binding protein [Mycobacterium bohemicum]ORV02711.1 amidase [Mycobacterium bohemicum]
MTTKLRKRLLAASAASALLLAGCSSSPPAAQPSVTFGGGAMPGMSGAPSTAGGPAGPAPATGSPAAATGDQVSIDNFAFAPATLTVKAGATVTWTNRDEEPHTVAASDGSFHSPGMGTGATYSHTFPTAGKFDYVCSIHPMMHGTVVVTG